MTDEKITQRTDCFFNRALGASDFRAYSGETMQHLRTLRIRLLALLGLVALVPAYAMALSFNNDPTGNYRDYPFSKSENAGIAVLSQIGAVEGNPDGRFHPERQLNRAEFVKIALLSKGIDVGGGESCFPDVRSSDWFSPYVCEAKTRGIVQGNPDGLFHPERPVNFAEAVKILVELYDFELPVAKANERWAWYRPYILAAGDRGLLFNQNMDAAAFLTRGQMARIAAAFVADAQGELDLYWDFEKGIKPASSSSSTSGGSVSSSSSSISSSSSVSSVSSSSSSAQNLSADFPAKSRFLMLGERSQPMASVSVFAELEPMFLRNAQVQLVQREDGIDTMFLVDADGIEIGQLSLDSLADSNRRTWTGTFTGTYKINKGETKVLGVEVRMKSRDGGGVTDRQVQVNTMRLSTIGEWSSETATTTPPTFTFPISQTVQGRITSVVNALPATGTLPLGNDQMLAAFTIGGTHVPQAALKIETIEFNVSLLNVNTANWELGTQESPDRMPCTVNDSTVSCDGLPEGIGSLTDGPRAFTLFADVTLPPGTVSPSLQVSINQPGGIGDLGAIRWNDGSASFHWTEFGSPIAKSTSWR